MIIGIATVAGMIKAFAVFLLSGLLPGLAVAQDLGSVVEGTFLPGWRTEDGRHMAALRIRLKPGWKTYWRAPGDAGIPPQFIWEGSRNLASASYHWPVPDVFRQNGLRSVGYQGEVVIPIEFTLADPETPAEVSGRVLIGICEDICVPADLKISGTLPVSGRGTDSDLIVAALADRPMTAKEAGVTSAVCRFTPIADGLSVEVTVSMPSVAPQESAVVEFSDPAVWVSEPEVVRRGGSLVIESDFVPPEAEPFAVSRSGVRVTILGDGRAVDIQGCSAG